MDIAKDIIDKYPSEQIVAYLDRLIGGVVKNYKLGLQSGRPEFLWSSLGDIVQVREIIHEIKTRDDARLAQAQKQ